MAIAHASYSKIPPIVKNSFVFGWSDPQFDLKRMPTPDEITAFATQTHNEFISNAIFPKTKATRNIFFVSLMLIISSLRSNKELILSGFDPEASGYYSTGNKEINSQRINDLLQTNHLINAWDGRNERVNLSKMGQKDIVKQLTQTYRSIRLAQFDSEGIIFQRNLVPEFIEAFPLYIAAIRAQGINISYLGESKLLSNASLPRTSY